MRISDTNYHLTEDTTSYSRANRSFGITLLVIGTLFFCYELFLRAFIGSLANQIIPSLHLNTQTYAILASVYYCVFGLMQIPAGIIYDKYRIERVLFFSLAICIISSMMFNHAHNFSLACLARVFTAMASAFAFIGICKIITLYFPSRWFGALCGLSQLIAMMGAMLATGPLVTYQQHMNWHTAIRQLNVLGMVIVLVSLFTFFLPQKKTAHNSGDRLSPFQIMKDIATLFKKRTVILLACYTAFNYVPLSCLCVVWGTLFLETSGLSQQQAANAIAFGWIGYAVMCPIIGYLYRYIQSGRQLMIICSFIGTMASIVLLSLDNAPMNSYVIILFLIGGSASGQTIAFAIISQIIQANLKATALGLNNTFVFIINILTPLCISYTIMTLQSMPVTLSKHSVYSLALIVIPALFIASIVFAMMLKKSDISS